MGKVVKKQPILVPSKESLTILLAGFGQRAQALEFELGPSGKVEAYLRLGKEAEKFAESYLDYLAKSDDLELRNHDKAND